MKTILCYGDSNTWGYNASEDRRFCWKERYPGVLSGIMGEAYHIVENGLCGRTTRYDSEIEPFVNGLKEAGVCAEVNAPMNYAVVMLGTNDCKDMYQAALTDIREGIREICNCFCQKGAQILLVSPPAMRDLKESPFRDEFGEGAEEKSLQLKTLYFELAEQEGWMYLDADSIVKAGNFDRIHLDKEGHVRLAAAVGKMIKDKEAWV